MKHQYAILSMTLESYLLSAGISNISLATMETKYPYMKPSFRIV